MRTLEPSGGLAAPKTYLTAWLLVMLKEQNLHGYEILKELRTKFDVMSDASTVYRALRQLETEGYISSWWDPNGQGPPRRIYTITIEGQQALMQWSVTLEQYRSKMNAFFTMYGGELARD